MDHPGALRHAADDEAVAGDDCLLRLGVGREDRLGGGVAAVLAQERDRVREPGRELLHRQRGADDAGREHEHLLRFEAEEAAGLGCRGDRVELAVRARGRVRDARVDHDDLRLGLREVRLRDDERRREDAVSREHRRADGGRRRADDGEIEVRAADARVHAGRDEALRGCDAHTSTPARRSPAVSSRPSARFAFCIA